MEKIRAGDILYIANSRHKFTVCLALEDSIPWGNKCTARATVLLDSTGMEYLFGGTSIFFFRNGCYKILFHAKEGE